MDVIVTGANRGIGLELVRQLLARGDSVHAACRRPDEAGELRATGAQLHAVDVADGASVAAFAHALADRPIDLVINNAGVYGAPKQRLQDFDYEAATRTFEINALGALRVSQAFVPHLRRGTGKKLAHISSMLGSISSITAPDNLAYRVSKAALNMISRSIALELHDDRIISIVVHPGWVRTAMGGPNAPTTPGEAARAILAQIDGAGLADSGEFVDWQGARCSW
ncbi:MAG TPA: SDR family oxidoreductase [Kofleriaceae bacterium]|jgi:NAD(P)-dependent dehydrogenase (short-subunit alcohol dehydrogenase family)